jgi:signal transduction histidine kinase
VDARAISHNRIDSPSNDSHAIAQLFFEAQEKERARIGRDLHDGIGQEIALLGVRLQNAISSVTATDEMMGELSQLVAQTERIASLLREVSHDLHPARLQYLGLPIAITSMCREFSTARKIEIRCQCDSSYQPSAAVGLAVYRVLQEALRNIATHSEARAARVDLLRTDYELILKVKDYGNGFDAGDPRLREGLGLISMKERVYSLGGSITISSTPGVGTYIEARVPIAAAMEQRSLA